MQNTTSRKLLERAKVVIPQGIYGHYAGAVRPDMPMFFGKSHGARFTDVDGNSFIDWACAYGPMILGYQHPAIEQASAAQAARGNTVSLASPVLIELAESLVDLVSGADWALFGKNGADATNLAVMIARAETGRQRIIKIDGGYHGSVPWMQAPGAAGSIPDDHTHVTSIPWNDLDALRAAIDQYGDDIACFISSPYHHPILIDNELPAEGWWAGVSSLCAKAGIVTILDDVRAGFRIDLSGSHVAYGFQPDLMCFGKALANGHPISALTGTDALRSAASKTFYTGTQFFNAAPMAAALATLAELQKADAARRAAEIGQRLSDGLREVAAVNGYELRVSGVPAMPYYRLVSNEGRALHRRWITACVHRGAFLLDYHNNFVSAAHTEQDVADTLTIASDAFEALASGGG
jgi:glutamate-1-semialdehyde 2,1-aminomutase